MQLFLQLVPLAIKNAPQGAGVIGWTAAIAAFGPLIFATLIGASIDAGAPALFFWGAAAFYLIATAVNWPGFRRYAILWEYSLLEANCGRRDGGTTPAAVAKNRVDAI